MNAISPDEEFPLIGARQMLVDQVFETILSLLLDDRIPTGAPLSIDGLAKRFKVSSTPVREALARLESTGMVRREALKGYRVAPEPTPADVEALLVTRRVLEPAIAGLACEKPEPSLVSDLERFNQELDQSRLGGTTFAGYRAYWKADEQFHRRIAESTGNDFLLRAYSSVEGHIQRFRLMVQNDMSGEHTVREHDMIIGALRSGDPGLARTAMEAHLDGIRNRWLSLERFARKG